MITNINVMNRFWVDGIARGEVTGLPPRWYLISIHNKPEDLFLTDAVRASLKKQGCVGMLSVMFHDLTPQEVKEIRNYEALHKETPRTLTLFSEDEARQIIAFVQAAKQDPLPAVLMVHCDGGVSRSGAVGTWINDFLNMDYNKFIKRNPETQPNTHILKTLRDVSGMNDQWSGKKPVESKPSNENNGESDVKAK